MCISYQEGLTDPGSIPGSSTMRNPTRHPPLMTLSDGREAHAGDVVRKDDYYMFSTQHGLTLISGLQTMIFFRTVWNHERWDEENYGYDGPVPC